MADGSLTVMVINKYLSGATPVNLCVEQLRQQQHGASLSAHFVKRD
jgi:hypothetical protein